MKKHLRQQEFARKAQEAEDMAEKSRNQQNRQEWLRIAITYRQLAKTT